MEIESVVALAVGLLVVGLLLLGLMGLAWLLRLRGLLGLLTCLLILPLFLSGDDDDRC